MTGVQTCALPIFTAGMNRNSPKHKWLDFQWTMKTDKDLQTTKGMGIRIENHQEFLKFEKSLIEKPMIRNSFICKLINVQANTKENEEKKIKNCDETSKLIKVFPKVCKWKFLL